MGLALLWSKIKKQKITLSFASPEKEFFFYLWCDYMGNFFKKLCYFLLTCIHIYTPRRETQTHIHIHIYKPRREMQHKYTYTHLVSICTKHTYIHIYTYMHLEERRKHTYTYTYTHLKEKRKHTYTYTHLVHVYTPSFYLY